MQSARYLTHCAALALLVLASACSDTPEAGVEAEIDAGPPVFDAGTADDRNAVTPGQLCERVSQIQCAGEAYCCDEPGRTYATCQEAQQSACKKELHLDEVADDAITGFDASIAERILGELEALALACDPSITAWGASSVGLRAMLQGSRALGANCAPRNNSMNAVLAGAALASCTEPETQACLPRGTVTDGKLDWTCDARSELDGRCFSDLNCQEGLYCDNPSSQLYAECRTRKAEGEPCTLPQECQSYHCNDDDRCAAPDVQVAFCLSK